MSVLSLPRMALVLGLLGSGTVGATAALAAPWRAHPASSPTWVQAQRTWADQSYRQTQRRLDQLEHCLRGARQRWDHDQCLRRDEQARRWQRQHDHEQWQVLWRRHGVNSSSSQPWSQPWRPVIGI